MKHITILLIFIFALSCKNDTTKTETKEDVKTESTTVNTTPTKSVETASAIAFLKDIKSLEKDTSSNPIEAFKDAAEISAKEVISLNKDNIKEALVKAKDFKYAVITVKDHTIVKLDLKDCKPSGSWSACMPKAEGYIKKGDLIHQSDYANNIIGLPDNQERLLYLF